MPTAGTGTTRATAAAAAGRRVAGRAAAHLYAAGGQAAFGLHGMATAALDWGICVFHAAQGFETLPAFFTSINISWHK